MDFDKGLGIGGLHAGRWQAGELSEMIARGEIRLTERKRIGPMPHGQLWEPCPRCDEEPVCLDCMLCENHCVC